MPIENDLQLSITKMWIGNFMGELKNQFMEKNIKDYLHLYLGCECDLVKDNEFHFPHPVTLNAALLGNAIQMPQSYKVKPILRPLSDMTEDEDKECHNIMVGEYATKVKYQNIIHYEGEKIKYLLSKHFDIFGLIESGLAIDATALKPTHG